MQTTRAFRYALPIGAAFFLLADMGSTFAASTDCQLIKSDVDRLKCYDATQKLRPNEDAAITKAKSSILRKLKDPQSARFEGITRRKEAVCGFVNAKNSHGGYVGKTIFVYLIRENAGYLLEVGGPDAQRGIEVAEKHCAGVPGF